MSNRSLIEINHDYLGEIERDPEGFGKAILAELCKSNGRPRDLRPGVRWFGLRHHSDKFKVQWGGYTARQT